MMNCRLYIKCDIFNWNVTKRKQQKCSCQLDCTLQISDSYSTNISDSVERAHNSEYLFFWQKQNVFLERYQRQSCIENEKCVYV